MVRKSIALGELFKSMQEQTWGEQCKEHAGNTVFQGRWDLWRTLRNQKAYWRWDSYTINILAPYKKMIGWVNKTGTRARVGCWSGSEDVKIRQRKEVRIQLWQYHKFSCIISSAQFSCSVVSNSATPWITAHQASLSITNSWSPPKPMSIESVMSFQPSHPLSSPSPPAPKDLPASGSFPISQLFAWGSQSIGVSASTSILPMNTQDWSPLEWTGWISLQSKGLLRVFFNTTVQKHQFFGSQFSL